MPDTRFAVYFVLFTVMLDAIGVGLMMPVMPQLLLELGDADLSKAAIWGGVLSSVFAVMMFLFGPVLGNLSDRFGRRPVLLVSMAAMCVDYIIMGMASSLWMLFIGRVIHGMAAANHSTAGAVIADVSSSDKKAANFGLLGAAFGIGFVMGPLLGAFLAEWGSRAPFLGAAVLVGANTVFGFFVFHETLPVSRRREFRWRRANPLGAFAALGRLPGQGRMMLVVLFQEMAFIVYPAVWAYFTLEQFGWGPRMVGLSLAGYGLLLALMQGVLIRWTVARFGEYRTAVFGLLVAAVSFIFTSVNPYGWLGFAFLPIMSLGALATPAIQGMMSRAVPDDAQGELQGIIASIRAVAMIFGPLLMTGLFSYFTRQDTPFHFPGAPFVLSTILTLAALSALWGAGTKMHKAEQSSPLKR